MLLELGGHIAGQWMCVRSSSSNRQEKPEATLRAFETQRYCLSNICYSVVYQWYQKKLIVHALSAVAFKYKEYIALNKERDQMEIAYMIAS